MLMFLKTAGCLASSICSSGDPLPNSDGVLYPISCFPFAGDAGMSELVDAPIGAEERVSMMGSAEPEEGVGATANGDMQVDAKEGNSEVVAEVKVPEEAEPEWVGHLRSIDGILGGSKSIALHQEFLIRNNNSDLQVLKNTKVSSKNTELGF